MQKLHLVGFSAELDGLIFSLGKGSDEFVVDVDGNLLQTIAEAERRRDRRSSVDSSVRARQQARSGHASDLSPRELQDRLRAGWSIEQVANEAGTDVEWVSRFAAPVRAEQARIVDRAVDLTFDKPRLGPSSLPLGHSVLRNLGERGVRFPEEDIDSAWGAYQLEEGLWVVRFSYTSRGRAQEAEWLFDLETSELSPRNRLASQLGHVPKSKARQPVATVTSPPAAKRSRRSGARTASPAATTAQGEQADAVAGAGDDLAPAEARAGGRRPTAAKKAAAKRRAPRKRATAKKKAAPKKAAPKKAAGKKAVTKAATKTAATGAPAVKKAAGSAPATTAEAARMPATGAPAKKARGAGNDAAATKARASKVPSTKAAATRGPAKRAPATRTAAKKAPSAGTASAKKAAPKEAPPAPPGPPATEGAVAGPAPAETATPRGRASSASATGGTDGGAPAGGNGDTPGGVTDAGGIVDDDGFGSDPDGDGDLPAAASSDSPDRESSGSRGSLRFEPTDPVVPIPMPPVRPPAATRPPPRGPVPAREPATMPTQVARREAPPRPGRQAPSPPAAGRIFRRQPASDRQPPARPRPGPTPRPARKPGPPAADSPSGVHGPLPPPAPVPVPGKIKEAVTEPIGEPPAPEVGDLRRSAGPAPSSGREPEPTPRAMPPGEGEPRPGPGPQAGSAPPAPSSRLEARAAIFRHDLARQAGTAGSGDESPASAAGDRPAATPSGQKLSSALDALANLQPPAGAHDQASSVRGRRRRRRRS